MRRALIGGLVKLSDGRKAVVIAINDAGTARVLLRGKQGLEAIYDVQEDTLQSIPWKPAPKQDRT